MRPITKWRIFRVLAAAEIDFFLFGHLYLQRPKGRALMAAITEGLLSTPAARTPPISPGF
jgi:hypothetical protein